MPRLETAMAGLIRGVFTRHGRPGSAAVDHPEHTVEHGAGVGKRPAAQFGTGPQFRQQRRDALPFFITNIAIRGHEFSNRQEYFDDIESSHYRISDQSES